MTRGSRRYNVKTVRHIAAAATIFVAAAVASPAVARDAGVTTTGPDPYVVVSVGLTDSRLQLSTSISHSVHLIAFRITNHGKKTHNFVIGVIRSPNIKPGGTAHLVAQFPDYGRYRFACTLNCLAALHGVFNVSR